MDFLTTFFQRRFFFSLSIFSVLLLAVWFHRNSDFFFSEYEFPGFKIILFIVTLTTSLYYLKASPKRVLYRGCINAENENHVAKIMLCLVLTLEECIFVLLIGEIGRLLWPDSFSI